MRCPKWLRTLAAALSLGFGLPGCTAATARPEVNLDGFIDWSGAITILHKGDFVDPYFTLQALLLAKENGLDISVAADKWSKWLLVRQKPDATFDRFCRNGPVWLGCKTADADDSQLALWLQLIDQLPAAQRKAPDLQASYERTSAALARLLEPTRGIYLVSPVFQQGLFMDNIEVWSYVSSRTGKRQAAQAGALASAINKVFWDPVGRYYLVSTQPEQKTEQRKFYPDHVAQLFPLMFDFPMQSTVKAATLYRQWMASHRAEWLGQTKTDFAWGLLAVLAIRRGDTESAACWLRETQSFRHTPHWTVTDEVARQILLNKNVAPALSTAACK